MKENKLNKLTTFVLNITIKNMDLLIIFLFILVYLLIPKNIFRDLAGFIIMFFVPGYLISRINFFNNMSNTEKIGIIFPFNIAIVSVSGYILFNLTNNLDFVKNFISSFLLVIIIIIISINYIKNRNKISLESSLFVYKKKSLMLFKKVKNLDLIDLVLTIIILVLLITAFTQVYLFFDTNYQDTDTNQTLFYYKVMSNSSLLNFPNNETLPIKIYIENHEKKEINYTLEIWLLRANVSYNDQNLTQEECLFNKTILLKPLYSNNVPPSIDFSVNFESIGHFILFFILFKEIPHNSSDNYYSTRISPVKQGVEWPKGLWLRINVV